MMGLKIVLWIYGVLCLLGVVCAALPWAGIVTLCQWFAVPAPDANAVTVYLIRLSLAMTGMVGVFFIVLALDPLRYGAMLSLAGWGLFCYALFCLVGGVRYGLPALAYVGDVVFGFVAGALIVAFRKKAVSETSAESLVRLEIR